MTSDPHDRLTALCAEMTAVLDAKGDDVADVKCVVFLQDGDRGGLQIHGYEGESEEDVSTEALADLFLHLRAIFRANGKELMFAPLQGRPEDQ
jgi:hypothetical protein